MAAVTDPGPDVFDQDHDGLSNILETGTYHSEPAVADSDGDGLSDGMEVAAGTSPSDGASFFAVKSIDCTPGGLRLTWDSVHGRIYNVQSTAELAVPAWVDALPPINADGPLTSAVMDVSPTAERMFYRLMVLSRY